MTLFTKPQNLNGTELIAELAVAGIIVPRVLDNGDGTIELATDDAKATKIVADHNGTQIAPEPTIAEKLASVGLSIEELKAALA
jgi:hypothetical protein